MNQTYVDLLTPVFREKDTADLLAMLAAPDRPAHERAALRTVLRERGALADKRQWLAVFLLAWPWLPLLTFLLPNFIGWVIVYFVMIDRYPVGAISAAIGTALAAACLRGHRYYSAALINGTVAIVVWYGLHLAARSGALGHVHT